MNGYESSMHSARRIRILCAVTDRGYCWFARAVRARRKPKTRPLLNPETALSGRMNQEER